MCGIFGVIGRDALPGAQELNRLTDMVAHRGPDGRGVLVRGCVGFGHRRLSIIDLSEDGRQPMWHASEPVCITYNGEVYNHIELRRELAGRGHRFQSRTDTEVILAAYLEWGRACVTRFNGMWAFAILDERTSTVFCSRDRFGVKPFYWTETREWFAFGSEISQVLPLCARRAAEGSAVRDFLTSGLSDHSGGTFFSGVMNLRPGHNLSYDLVRHTFQIEKYYDLRGTEIRNSGPSAIVDEFRSLLTDAVRLRLRSDVRVGTCLSGGLDSSAIATIAAGLRDHGSGPLAAVTGISEQQYNNEEEFAKRVVDWARLEWVRTTPRFEDFEGSIEDIVLTQGEPFGGPSVCMQYFVMKAARANGISVLLDGQGGDESLFGYERYYAIWLRDCLRVRGLRGLCADATDALENNTNISRASLAGMLLGSFWPRIIGHAMLPRLRSSRFKPRLPEAWRAYVARLDDAVAIQRSDVQSTSLPMLLRFEDRNSMRHSIETRLPFLDYRLMEFTLGMPISVKMRGGWAKWPLRKAMQGSIPDEIVWRKNKLGFEAPDREWLAQYRSKMAATVGRSRLLVELFGRKWLEKTYARLDRSIAWRLYSFAAWESRMNVTDLI